MTKKARKKTASQKTPESPPKKAEVPFEAQVQRIVDTRIAKALADVATNMQQYFGLNVVGAEMQATAKRLENGKLK